MGPESEERARLIREVTGPVEKVARQRANDLDGATWTRCSISVWGDVRKSREEVALGHPASFPEALPARLIQCFTRSESRVVLDPFAGTGTTLVAARNLGGHGIGFEVSGRFVEQAEQRLAQAPVMGAGTALIHRVDARRLLEFVEPESVDLVVTSPPYWDILSRARTADYKPTLDYGNEEGDISTIPSYRGFLMVLQGIFRDVAAVVKPGCYCCVNVMDIRKGSQFYPFHCDLARVMERIGFVWDDLIVWDRRADYSNIRPLGYPRVFRVNKVHEFILIFKKPSSR